ncbi:hypothetical protein Hdeb2414_s0023g00644361 [Helianthus debilis subsp. tardiflorus]
MDENDKKNETSEIQIQKSFIFGLKWQKCPKLSDNFGILYTSWFLPARCAQKPACVKRGVIRITHGSYGKFIKV